MPRIPEWPRLNPSDLRHSVEIQSPSATRDAAGQPVNWSAVLTAFASIEAVKENELYQLGQLTSQVTHTITLRYPVNVSISAGMRVIYGSHTYQIQAVNNVDERNILLKLLCLELNASE